MIFCAINHRMKNPEQRLKRLLLLGRRIRKFREQSGLTIADLAALAGIASTTLADIERGKGNPRFDTLCALSEGLGLSVTLLVQQDEGIMRDIFTESAKELLRHFSELSDSERQKFEQLIVIFKRLNKWNNKN